MRLKAAEARRFLPILSHMLERFFSCDSPHEVLRYQCTGAMCRVYLELNTWTTDSTQQLARHARQHLLLYHQLEQSATSDRYWHMYPKHHVMVHVCEMARSNTRTLWNYIDEDEVGNAAAVGRTCAPRHLNRALTRHFRHRYLRE